MTVQAILADKGRDVATITADATVFEAVHLIGQHRIGALPVLDRGKVTGIISERDIIYCLRDHGSEVLDWKVSQVMTSPALTAGLHTEVLGALAMMTKRRVRHLPVIDGGQLVGIVSIGDLVKYRIDRIEQEANAMRDYIRSA